jgi:hypothetical protein
MRNQAAAASIRGAWVGKCPRCGTCCLLPKLPAIDYAGQRVVRPGKFTSLSVPCACGHRFLSDGDNLMFVTIASLSIQRLSPDVFAVEENFGGVKTERGPVSETELWAYLNSHTLIDIIPSHVITFLNVSNALDLDMILSVVRAPLADSQLARS